MSRTTAEITAQCDAGIISIAEARCALSLVLKQARRTADYGVNSIDSYKRHNRVAAEARRALVAL